jgi:hypothetical protein
MTITTFKNMKGLIHGKDPKRIDSAVEGVLKIGSTEINVSPLGESIMPLLYHGATGDYEATFTDKDGRVFHLSKVAVRGGRIAPPPATEVEIMELRCRADELQDKCDALERENERLGKIFDTDALNFLIK